MFYLIKTDMVGNKDLILFCKQIRTSIRKIDSLVDKITLVSLHGVHTILI